MIHTIIAAIPREHLVSIYLLNQVIDIFLWSWIILVMIKRVICRGFNLNYCTLKEIITKYNFSNITKKRFKLLLINHYYISDVLLLIAAIIAVIQFSNQFYYHSVHMQDHILSRTFIWMIFHKLITVSILIRYKDYQPQLFVEIKREVKQLFNIKQIDKVL